jgi:hypothetical protein
MLTCYLQAQDCYDCGKRNIYVYSFEMRMTAPAADHDSIMNFYNALKVAPAVIDYLKNTDPTRECISPDNIPAETYLDTTRALTDPGILPILAEFQFHEPLPSEEAPDYYITGYVEPSGTTDNKYLFVDFFLQSSQRDVLNSGFAPLQYYPAGDVSATVAEAMSQKLGNAFQLIRDYEVNKRNSGVPYAIQPTLTGTASKGAIDFNETTTINFTLKDCDGVGLENRVINISDYIGGTVDKTSLTTDSNGETFLQFTAGTTAGVGVVIPSVTYTRPCGKPGKMDLNPVYLEIKRPADSWLVGVDYKFNESRKSSYQDDVGETKSGSSHISENIYFAAWVKAYPLPYPLPGYFISDPALIDLKIGGMRAENGQANKFWSSSAGYIRDNIWTDIYAKKAISDSAGVNIHIDWGTYHFTLSNLTAPQSGGEHRIYDTWDIIGGNYHEDTTFPADSTRDLFFSINDVSRDTSYSYTEWVDNGDTREETSVNQTCLWIPDTSFILKYKKNFTYEMNHEDIGWKESETVQMDFSLKITMLYNGTPSTGVNPIEDMLPKKFSLSQNFPNPFNPTTVISYQLPISNWVTLKVYDVLGKEVASIVNGVEEPGYKSVKFDATKLSSGPYFYRLQAGSFVQTNKMLLMK